MSRRRPEEDSSLELLLDTICNAFGGILFLTILVAVLLRLVGPATSQEPVSDEAHQNIVSLEETLLEQQSRLETLTATVAEHERTSDRLADKARIKAEREGQVADQIISRIAGLRHESDQLNVQRTSQMAKNAGLQKELERNRSKVRQLDQALAAAEVELSKQASTLKEEKAARTKAAKLPSPRAADTRGLTLVVRYNEVFQPYTYDDLLFTEEVNLQEFVVTEESNSGLSISPRIGTGITLLDQAALKKGLVDKLDGKSPHIHHVSIAIWDDSYQDFANLKDALIEMGFKYRLIPCNAESKVIKTRVPNAQVQ